MLLGVAAAVRVFGALGGYVVAAGHLDRPFNDVLWLVRTYHAVGEPR